VIPRSSHKMMIYDSEGVVNQLRKLVSEESFE
jgi:hypothetical protein